jgi:hypothetical protein
MSGPSFWRRKRQVSGRASQEKAADALEVLAHLRRPEGHGQGCWLVRLALGEK